MKKSRIHQRIALFFLPLLFWGQSANAQYLYPVQDKRTDSIEMLHTSLKMDFRNIQSKKINAQANIRLKAKADLTTLRIDLERLIIDSIYCDGASCAFNQSFVDVIITFNKTIKKNDTFNTVIYYQGTPRKDPSGFGGFYFNNDYAYAIGVGFLADPHPFGRSWFPCFDNFVTKGTYSFNITTDTGFAALCGGTLDSSITNNAKTNWYYTLHQPTPSYLISLAVSRYELLEGKFNTTQGPIPYILAAQAQDTQNLKSSFINFGKAVDAFIHFYGPYNWDRLGYHVVPFNGGAMEHACNISYPLFAVNGNTSREDLMAHELAHSWWGNNITCRTQEDMWINEGWASYSEKLFNEFVYGKERYREKVEETHRNVLQFAHIADGEILPVSGIGHEHTYGRHVYRKGADIAHSLRFYMGDSSFFKAIKHIMTTKAYGNMDSKELIDSFQKFTSYDLSHFYKGWVIGKGFSHLSIKTWSTKEDGSGYMTNVGVLQRNRWNGTPHKIIPTEIYFLKPDFTTESFRIDATEFQSNFDFRTSYKPLAVGIDLHSKLNDATTDTFQFIDQKGNYVFHDGLMELQVTEVNEKAFVHVTHHWIGAETNTQTEQLPVLSRDRYWSVEGYFPDGFKAQGTIKYNGQTATTSGDNFLDNQLIRGTEDSLVLMFRPDAFSVWEIADATINTGVAKFDRRGSFTINNLQKGEYALAIYNQALLTGNAKNAEGLKIYPNPTKNHLHIEFKSFSQPGYILITDSTGKVILKKQIKHSQNNLDLLTQTWAAGTYKVLLSYPNGEDQSASFTVTK